MDFERLESFALSCGTSKLIDRKRLGKKITFGSKVIKKTFTGVEAEQQVAHLVKIYERLNYKKVPHTDDLKWMCADRKYVYLGPKGIAELPGSKEELIDAVLCVLKALVVRRLSHYVHHRAIK